MDQDAESDIERIEKLQFELRSCREDFHNIIGKSADPTLIVDRDGVVRFANAAAADLFCRDSTEIVGQQFGFPVIHGDRTEIEVVCHGRPVAVVEMRSVETEWNGEKAWLADLRDVTERKNLERELQQALQRSEEARSEIDAILRSVAEGLIVTDRNHQIVLMNQSAELMLGLACRQVSGLPVDQVFEEEPWRGRVLDALKGGNVKRFDLEVCGGSQEGCRILQAWTSEIRGSAGEEAGSIITLQDVTSRREIERMKSEFVSIAAHDLRSPLTTIIGYTEIMQTLDDLGEENLKEFLGIIRDQAFSMADIIDNFLDISRIESGKGIVLQKSHSSVEELLLLIEPFILIKSDKFNFKIELEGRDTPLFIDAKRMRQVLVNLLGNAVNYSPGGGEITIEGRPSGKWYQFSIQDRGIGMTPGQVARIFEKFYRADTSPEAPRGIGLGMSIVKSLVEAHGGKIWVESEIGRGTTVYLNLPFLSEGIP